MVTWPAETVTDVQQALAAIAGSDTGLWAFSVREEGQVVASVNGATVMPAASTIKVALMVLALADVASGERGLDDTVPVPDERSGGAGVLKVMPSVRALRLTETLELMIGVSDNTAANMVIDLLGQENITARIHDLGLADTRVQRRLMDRAAAAAGRENVTTADDQARLLDLLNGPDLLPSDLRRLALDILGRQQFNDRLPSRLGPDVVCRHKTGELTGVRHDVGILEFDGRALAFAALGSQLTDPATHSTGTGVAGEVIGSASRTVVDLARSSAGLWT